MKAKKSNTENPAEAATNDLDKSAEARTETPTDTAETTSETTESEEKVSGSSAAKLFNESASLAEQIARVCHEANGAWCLVNGDDSQKSWEEAEQWQRESAIKGVQFRLENPSAQQYDQHNAWMEDKLKDGWKFGEVKNAEAKTHPCLVPYNLLPRFQQKKDEIFCAIVDCLKA